MTLHVLDSAFNQPNMIYFVVLENGSASSKDTDELILGNGNSNM